MSWDNFLRNIESFVQSINSTAKQAVGSYSCLETTDGDYNLVAGNGALASVIRLDGNLKAVSSVEYNKILELFSTNFSSVFKSRGYSLQVVFSYNPTDSQGNIKNILNPSFISASNLGFDMESLLNDWVSSIANYCANEQIFFVLWTSPEILSKSQQNRANKTKSKNRSSLPIVTKEVQNLSANLEDLVEAHHRYVEIVTNNFDNLEMEYELLEVHEALKVIRSELDPEWTSKNWRPSLLGDPLPLSYPEAGENDLSCLLYPSLTKQLFPREALDIDRKTVKLGDNIHSGVSIELLPQKILPFNELFRPLKDKNFCWRMSLFIGADGLGGLGLAPILSSLLAFTSSSNKQFNMALEELKQRDLLGETLVSMSVCIDTWVNAYEPNAIEKLRENTSELAGLVQNWGACEVSEILGDPLLSVAGTVPALMQTSPAKRLAMPLIDSIDMLPLTRVASPWHNGSVLFRTPDGKPYGYAMNSSSQNAWVDLGVAPMGSGKSVFLNTLNLGFILQAGLSRLPFLTIIDVGPSSSGLIQLIKASLPPDKQYLAIYERLKLTKDYSINLFDTPLGYRKPPPAQLNFLVNFLSLLCTPLASSEPPNGVTGLANLLVERIYQDLEKNPHLFERETDSKLTQVIEDLNIHIDSKTSWWEITDDLFDLGYLHEAVLAQRYAVPLLSELMALCNEPRIKELYSFTYAGEEITAYLQRCLVESIKLYPIFNAPTVFDIGDAHIVSLDLDEVAKSGGSQGERQAAIMFMVARQVGASKFFFMETDAHLAPEKYKKYHLTKIEEIRRDPKRLCYDEAHRVLKKGSVIATQIVSDIETIIRESRKWSISVGLYSQDISDFPDIIVNLATSVFILGANTETVANSLADTFSLNTLCKNAITRLGSPGLSGSKLVAKFVTSKGNAQQVLVSTLGKQMIWAFSTTTEDVAVRNALYKKLGVTKTLQILAKYYGGGIKKEVENRKQKIGESGLDKQIDVIDTLIEELQGVNL